MKKAVLFMARKSFDKKYKHLLRRMCIDMLFA